MKFSSRIVVVLIALVLCWAVNGSAEWRIDIESKTVSPGETGVTVDITGYWELGVSAVTIPLIAREIDAGSFWTGTLPQDLTGEDPVGVEWKWENPGWAMMIEQVLPVFVPNDPIDWCCPNVDPCTDPTYDGVSPDQFAIQAQGLADSEPAHPDGHVFLTLTFDVTTPSITGSFELDTACMSRNINTIYLVDNTMYMIDHGPSASGGDFDGFYKGIITIEVPNEPPVWAPIPPKEVDEGARLLFDVSASDPDGHDLTLSVEGDVPAASDFTDNGDGTGQFDWTPDFTESGIYIVQFIAADWGLADTDFVEITVNDAGAILEVGEGVPTEYALGQNFPNPFNASTRIEFALRQGGHAKLEVFNILGQSIATPVDGHLPAGSHSVIWDGAEAMGKIVPSGLYFYRLVAGDYTEMKKMVLMK